jgi:hypothetical protein
VKVKNPVSAADDTAPSKTAIVILAKPTNYFHNKICQLIG